MNTQFPLILSWVMMKLSYDDEEEHIDSVQLCMQPFETFF